MLSKVKLLAATLAMMSFAAVPAIAQDNTAIGGNAENNTGDIQQSIQQDQNVNQEAQISGGQGQTGDNTIDQNNEQNANQYANTGDNVAEGGDASIFDFFGFFSRLFG